MSSDVESLVNEWRDLITRSDDPAACRRLHAIGETFGLEGDLVDYMIRLHRRCDRVDDTAWTLSSGVSARSAATPTDRTSSSPR